MLSALLCNVPFWLYMVLHKPFVLLELPPKPQTACNCLLCQKLFCSVIFLSSALDEVLLAAPRKWLARAIICNGRRPCLLMGPLVAAFVMKGAEDSSWLCLYTMRNPLMITNYLSRPRSRNKWITWRSDGSHRNLAWILVFRAIVSQCSFLMWFHGAGGTSMAD